MLSSYHSVLHDLATGLTDLQTATQQMSRRYTTTDDLNGMKVADLQSGLNATTADFNAMISANGGTTATAPATPGSGSGS